MVAGMMPRQPLPMAWLPVKHMKAAGRTLLLLSSGFGSSHMASPLILHRRPCCNRQRRSTLYCTLAMRDLNV